MHLEHAIGVYAKWQSAVAVEYRQSSGVCLLHKRTPLVVCNGLLDDRNITVGSVHLGHAIGVYAKWRECGCGRKPAIVGSVHTQHYDAYDDVRWITGGLEYTVMAYQAFGSLSCPRTPGAQVTVRCLNARDYTRTHHLRRTPSTSPAD